MRRVISSVTLNILYAKNELTIKMFLGYLMGDVLLDDFVEVSSRIAVCSPHIIL